MRLFEKMGAAALSRHLGIGERAVFRRRANLEAAGHARVTSPHDISERVGFYEKRLTLSVSDGVVLVGSDAHYWPGIISPAHRGFVELAARLSPKAIILNGDVVDGASASRHPPIGWEKGPTLKEEFSTCEERLGEIERAANGAALIWTLGNHDMRFESRLAANSKEVAGIGGMRLADHFLRWKLCWSAWINDALVIKHRFKGGIHAAHNNTLWAGKSMLTGHLHSLKVTPFTDYNGTRFGVDSGALADPTGAQFSYTEENPLNHRSGFVVLTFAAGRLLWPEIAAVVDANTIQFRGSLISV